MHKNWIPKIMNLLDKHQIQKQWVKVNDESGGIYNTNKQIRLKTSTLQSDLFNFWNAYIVIKGTMTDDGGANRAKYNTN